MPDAPEHGKRRHRLGESNLALAERCRPGPVASNRTNTRSALASASDWNESAGGFCDDPEIIHVINPHVRAD
jgi:hypothetical protein